MDYDQAIRELKAFAERLRMMPHGWSGGDRILECLVVIEAEIKRLRNEKG